MSFFRSCILFNIIIICIFSVWFIWNLISNSGVLFNINQQEITIILVNDNINESKPIIKHNKPKEYNPYKAIRGNYSFPYPFKIDVVYLWANSSDKHFLSSKNAARQYIQNNPNSNILLESLNITIDFGGIGEHSYAPTFDHGELKLALRSLIKYNTGWLGNIYIVSTFKQKPHWLQSYNTYNITMIDANKLLIKCLSPFIQSNSSKLHILHEYGTYNSHAIYLCLHFIDNLSEIFIQNDDDFIFFDTFDFNLLYDKFGNGINYLLEPERIGLQQLPKQQEIINILCDKYNKKRLTVQWAPHIPRVWNKTIINNIWQLFPIQLINTIFHPFRSETDIDLTSFYPIYQYIIYNINIKYFVHEAFLDINMKRSIRKYLEILINDILIRNHTWLKSLVLQDNIKKENYNYNKLITVPFDAAKFVFLLPAILGLKAISFEKCNIKNKNKLNVNVMGHRGIGYNINLVENTLENFIFTVEKGIYWIELDVALTLDNIVVVHHTEKYLYNGCNKYGINHDDISNITFNELKTNIKYAYIINNKIFTVSSMFEIFLWAKEYVINNRKNIHFQIELKQNTNVLFMNDCISKPTLDKCYKRNIENDKLINNLIQVIYQSDYNNICVECITISSFEPPRLNNFQRIVYNNYNYKEMNIKSIGFALIIGPRNTQFKQDEIRTLINAVNYWNLTDISVFYKAASKEFIDECRQNNIKTQIGMPGGGKCLQEIRKPHKFDGWESLLNVIQLNPDIVCTNQPIIAQTIIDISYKCPVHNFPFK